jgi:hypothetical protein
MGKEKENTMENVQAQDNGTADLRHMGNADLARAIRATCAGSEWHGKLMEELHKRKKVHRNAARKARDQAMRDLGMTKVRGALGGTYWE